jgi:uncharacterized protein (TIGR00251 family)
MSPPFLQTRDGLVYLAVKVQPRASANEIVAPHGNELKIKVTAPPVDSAANETLLEFLAGRLDCAPRAVQLVRGATSRHKLVSISGLSAETVLERLLPN